MLNKKGQSLVIFVLIMPVILFILILVYDVGNALYEKNRLSNTNYLATCYALDNIDSITEEDITNYIMRNSDNFSNIIVSINDNNVDIEIDKKMNGLISNNINLIDVRSKYVGKIENGEKNIERIK